MTATEATPPDAPPPDMAGTHDPQHPVPQLAPQTSPAPPDDTGRMLAWRAGH